MTEPKKDVAIVLGGIYPHAALMRKLQKRGYYTILVDYFDNPPAASSADEHSTKSAMDYEEVLQLARERDAKLVMSACLDQQMVIAMKVSEALGLPHPFDSDTALKVTNKKYMKRVMMENNIPTARYYEIDDNTTAETIELSYPIMVKAADASGAAGVYKLDTPEGFDDALSRAKQWSRTNTVIAEEYNQGNEVSIYAFISDGEAKIVTTSERISVMGEQQVRCYCCVSPSPSGEPVRERLTEIATNIARAFGLDNTPLFFQCIINQDDIHVLELSPRLGGGTCYRTSELNTQFDILDATIDSYLGNKVSVDTKKETDLYLVQLIYAHDGIFDHVEGLDELIKDGTVVEAFFLKTPGMEASNEKSSSARIATLLLRGQTEEELKEKAVHAMSRLEVRDPQGKPLMNRDLQFKGTEYTN